MRQIEFSCSQCSISFTSKKACRGRIPKYCSQKCYGLSLQKDRKCPLCNQHVTWNNKIYCSKKCEAKSKKGKPLSEKHKEALSKVKKGKEIPHLHKEEVYLKISRSLTGKPQPWLRGVNHPNYVDGGKAKFERQKAMGRVEYKTWRRSIFERDLFTCTLCSKKGGRIHADHILPWASHPEKRYEIENGRTLCVDCHRKTNTWGARSRKK